MRIKSINMLENGVIEIFYLETQNDIEPDFVCIAERRVQLTLKDLQECVDIDEIYELVRELDYEFIQEHVFDCPIAVNLEYLDRATILTWIHQF